MKKSVRYLTQASCIAAVYAVLTIITAPIAFGPIQVRFSEALCVLTYFTPAAVPGLFVGCIIGNVPAPMGAIDMVLGSLATLLSAVVSRRLPKYLVPLPSVIFNAVIVGAMMTVVDGLPVWSTVGTVAIGQTVACYGLGIPLMLLLERYGRGLFEQ